MAEAMAQIRAELGDDAIILEQRRTRHGVEVTAALEPDEPLLIQPLNNGASFAPVGPLDFHNIPASLAHALHRGPLPQSLAENLIFAALPRGLERPLLLAGPPGAGKTLTTAKLTARLVLSGTAPLVITTDGQRAGAVEQLAAFTRVLGVTLAVAPTPAMPAHPDAWPWQLAMPARFADADPRGQTSDHTLARCIEQARVQFLTKVFGPERVAAQVGFMVAHVALRWHWRRPIPATWQLGTGVQRVGERSMVAESASQR
jgi:hypothetical protein